MGIYRVTGCNDLENWRTKTEILGDNLDKDIARQIFQNNQLSFKTCYVIDTESGQIMEGVNRAQDYQMSRQHWNDWD